MLCPLLVGVCLAGTLGSSAAAMANVRSGSALDLQDAKEPSGDPVKPNRDIARLSASYDESGALAASVTFHVAPDPAQRTRLAFRWETDPSGTCSKTPGGTAIETSTPPTAGGIVFLPLGIAPLGNRSLSPDGRTLNVSFANPALAGLDFRCVWLQATSNSGVIDKAAVYFDGYAPPDKSAPEVKLEYDKTQRASAVSVSAQLEELGTVTASGSVAIPSGASKTYRFKPVRREVKTLPSNTLRLKLPKAALRAVNRALRRTKLKARITVSARDQVGNAKTSRFTVKLKR